MPPATCLPAPVQEQRHDPDSNRSSWTCCGWCVRSILPNQSTDSCLVQVQTFPLVWLLLASPTGLGSGDGRGVSHCGTRHSRRQQAD